MSLLMIGEAKAQSTKKTMQEQIAALQGYIQTAEKGYRIVSDGVHAINGIKNGEFNLHSAFFNSMQKVNPAIKHTAMVAEIITLQIAIVNQCKRIVAQSSYTHSVCNNLINESLKDIDALMLVITDGKVQMSDDERIVCIAKIHADMQDKYMFSQSFVNRANSLNVQQQQALNDITVLKQLNK